MGSLSLRLQHRESQPSHASQVFRSPKTINRYYVSCPGLERTMLLRAAEPADALAVARVHVRSWQAAYRSLLPDDYLDQLRPEDRAQKYTFGVTDPAKPHTIVADVAGVIRGFATTAPARDSDVAGYGELYALYVDPDHWGRGLGVALVSAARTRLVDQGFKDAVLWVMTGNIRAERFYRADRWTLDGHRRTEELWNVKVNELRYQRQL
jgi:GNAT superfamily N-acetyltransferase